VLFTLEESQKTVAGEVCKPADHAEQIVNNSPFLLEVTNLQSGYNKKYPVISDLFLHIKPGEIVGLIGPNGAGKSTTIKAILGLIDKYQGEVKLPGKQTGGYAYIPELPSLYAELTLWEHLEIMAMAYGIGRDEFKQRADRLLKQFHIEKSKHAFPGSFSKGMRQKVMIMCSYLVQPALYLVDEPFNGLDPFAVNELLEWFTGEKSRGAGLLLSTHVLDIAQKVCDRLILIKNGCKVSEGSLQDLRQQAGMEDAGLFDVFTHLMSR
jgi:ABC-2 type transport system ATP-binding protein